MRNAVFFLRFSYCWVWLWNARKRVGTFGDFMFLYLNISNQCKALLYEKKLNMRYKSFCDPFLQWKYEQWYMFTISITINIWGNKSFSIKYHELPLNGKQHSFGETRKEYIKQMIFEPSLTVYVGFWDGREGISRWRTWHKPQ